jgi:hypothetical protein
MIQESQKGGKHDDDGKKRKKLFIPVNVVKIGTHNTLPPSFL